MRRSATNVTAARQLHRNFILAYLCLFVNMMISYANKKAPTARVGIAVGAILPFNPPEG